MFVEIRFKIMYYVLFFACNSYGCPERDSNPYGREAKGF